MSERVLVNTDDLVGVADAIREKGGTEEGLEWPDGFVSAVEEIETGGGNPNSVETITGTLANPWGGTTLSELVESISNNGATALLTVGNETMWMEYNEDDGWISATRAVLNIFSGALNSAKNITYSASTGALVYAKNISSNGSASNISNTTSCTLTIIHHPLPET